MAPFFQAQDYAYRQVSPLPHPVFVGVRRTLAIAPAAPIVPPTAAPVALLTAVPTATFPAIVAPALAVAFWSAANAEVQLRPVATESRATKSIPVSHLGLLDPLLSLL
jgi:hypothetical protein